MKSDSTLKNINIENSETLDVEKKMSLSKAIAALIVDGIYEMPYTHEYIMTNSEETFVTEKNKDGELVQATQIKLPNNRYDTSIETPIRLDNQNINFLKRVKKNNDIPLEYINKKRREIFRLNELLDKSTSLIINKTLKK